MAAKRFEELIVWQRFHEFSVEVWKATNTGRAGADFKYRDQIRDASDSTARNVAEGFGRYNPLEFVRFLDIARGSALEVQALLKKGLAVGYWSQEEYDRLDSLARRGLQAVAKLQRYLRSTTAKHNAVLNRHRRGRIP